jgi:hypothetical protein
MLYRLVLLIYSRAREDTHGAGLSELVVHTAILFRVIYVYIYMYIYVYMYICIYINKVLFQLAGL